MPTQEVKNYDNNPDYHVLIAQGGTGISYIEYAMIKGEGEEYEPQFKPPFDDLKVRQAMAYGVDADEIITGVMAGLSTRNYGIMPTGCLPTIPTSSSSATTSTRTRPTASSMKRAGRWAPTTCARKTANSSRSSSGHVDPTYEKAVQVIQNQLGKVGIKLNISVLDVGTMLAQLPQNQQDSNIMGYGWPEPDILKVIAEGIAGVSPSITRRSTST